MSIEIGYPMLVGLKLLLVFGVKSVAFLSGMPLPYYCQKVCRDRTISSFGNEEPGTHSSLSPSWTSGRSAELPALTSGAFVCAGP